MLGLLAPSPLHLKNREGTLPRVFVVFYGEMRGDAGMRRNSEIGAGRCGNAENAAGIARDAAKMRRNSEICAGRCGNAEKFGDLRGNAENAAEIARESREIVKNTH